MKIKAEKTRYHRFTLYFDYAPDRVELCRVLKESFGWQRFSFDSLGDQKRWVFSEVFFVKLFSEKFPDELEIDPEVMNICISEDESLSVVKKREALVEEVRNKTTTDLKIKGIKGELYDYQKVGVEFLLASGGRAIVADPPGLGKTLQALGYHTHINSDRTIVVCPASVKSSWEKEIKKWTNMSYIIIDGKTKIGDIPADVKIWVINYDILRKHLDSLLKIRFELFVADECHYVKNHKTARTKAVRQLAKNIPHVVLLSGTPLLSRPVEMFTLLNMVDGGAWNNWFEFTRRYCGGHQGRWGYDTSGATNTEELHEKIKKYFIRRAKKDVLTQLPPKNRIDVPVKLEKSIAIEYQLAEKDFVEYLESHKGKNPLDISRIIQAEKLAQLNILRHLAAMGKLPSAMELAESIIEADEKILIFSNFVEPLNQLKEKFGDKAVIITGQTKVEERGEIIRKFQEDPSIKVFLGGMKSAGVGITLTAASNVLFLDYSWNPADHQQSEDRCHRPGQEASSVNIYQLYAEGTIDNKLQKMLERKREIFDRVVEGVIKEDQDTEKSSIAEVITDIMTRHDKK